MAESYVQVPADDVGKKIEMHEVTDGLGNVVQRQVIEVAAGPASQTVDGTVSVGNFPATYPVTDNSGSLTIDGSVSVSNFPATQPVSGSVTMADLAAALYQVLEVLRHPMSIEYNTGRQRVSIETLSSTAALGNITLIGSATPRDLFLFHAERNSWANSIGSRIT